MNSWKMQPELAAPKPRQVRSEELGGFKVIFFYVIASLVLAYGYACRLEAHLARFYILKAGLPGVGLVEGSRKESFRKGPDTGYVQLRYSTPKGFLQAEALVNPSLGPQLQGQEVPIHYLARRPDWVVLDSDGGAAKAAFIACAGFYGLFVLIGVWDWARRRKIKRLLIWGDAVPAKIEGRVVEAWDLFGMKACIVRYDFQGQEWRVKTRFMQGHIKHFIGETVTVLVDPDQPGSTMIYPECGYKVVSG